MLNKKPGKNPPNQDSPIQKGGIELNNKENGMNSSGKSPILKTPDNQAKTEKRNDAFGNQIKKGGKKHKISFRENMADVKEVENWKEYNVDDGNHGGPKCCSIF
jgi:hypothetical protein